MLPFLSGSRPGLPFALDGPREIKHFGVSSLMETEQNRGRGNANGGTKDEGRRGGRRGWQVPAAAHQN